MGRTIATTRTGGRSAELASTAGSVTAARHLVRDDLEGRGLSSKLVEDALVVVTELVGNAVRHARPLPVDGLAGSVRLKWHVSGRRIRIDVTDGGGPHRPHVQPHSLADTGGRGLAIVSAVARDWGVTTSDDNVTVYAVVEP